MKSQNRVTQRDNNDLVVAALNENLDAFNELVLNHQDMIYNLAYAILRNPVSAEDVTQDTFIKAFEKLKGFRGGSFRGWLMRIVTNSAYDMLRRSKRRPTQPLFPADENGDELESAHWLIDRSVSVQDSAEQNEFSKHIAGLLDELPDVYRAILIMIDMYEFDYAEAANALNIPLGTVKSRLARARLQMKEKILNEKKYAILPIPHSVREWETSLVR